jgi:ATP-dependent DNA ligase
MNDPNAVLDRLDNLKKLSKTNDKKVLLKEYLEDSDFLRFVELTLDTRKNYNVTELPEYKESGFTYSLKDLYQYFDYLANKRGCKDFEKEQLFSIACSHPTLYNIAKTILNKTLDCGCGAITINKVRPDTVEIFPYCRCSLVEEIGNIQYPAIVQEKLDGEYISVIVDRHNKVYHRTRSGNYLDLKGRFVKQFIDYGAYDCVYTGEIIATDKDGNYLSRDESNGLVLKAQSGTLTEEEADSFVIILWDVIGQKQFFNTSDIPEEQRGNYQARFAVLNDFFNETNPLNVKLVDYKIVYNYDEVIEFYKEKLEEGKEGVILKDFRLIFKNHTSKLQIKIKPFKTCELKMLSWVYGDSESKYRYCMGSVKCGSVDELILVDVGGGYSDKFRGYLGKDTSGNLIVGMDDDAKELLDSLCRTNAIMEVKFSYVTKDDTLYLPTSKGLRHDKKIADDYNYIKAL